MSTKHTELMEKSIRLAKITCREVDRVLAQAAELDLALEEQLEQRAIAKRRALLAGRAS